MNEVSQMQAMAGPPSLSQVIGRVAHAIDKIISPGDVADLRRIRPDEVSPAFYKLVAGSIEPEQEWPAEGPARDLREHRWAVILQAMAQLKGLHNSASGLGEALAHVAYSELRLVRLLRAHDDALEHEVRTCAHFLAAKATACNQTDIANLVLSDGREHAEKVRRRIARGYYRKSNRQEDKS